MNRKIKFRVWDKSQKRMKLTGIGISQGQLFGDKELIVMQFTGFTDKNGKDIYEGDIVNYDSESFANGLNCIIEWKGSGFYAHSHIPISEIIKREAKIIGNIYENPDLLTPTK